MIGLKTYSQSNRTLQEKFVSNVQPQFVLGHGNQFSYETDVNYIQEANLYNIVSFQLIL